jgi:hypothetical protein
LIQHFVKYVKWFFYSIIKDHIILGLMLMKANGHEYLPKKIIYDICVDVVHHYIGLYGFEWKTMYTPLDKFIFQILLLFILKNNFYY